MPGSTRNAARIAFVSPLSGRKNLLIFVKQKREGARNGPERCLGQEQQGPWWVGGTLWANLP